MPDFTQIISNYYKDLLGREPDAAGMANWQAALQGGMSPEDVQAQFRASPEFETHATDYVGDLYQDVLGREADPMGLSGWVEGLQGGMGFEDVLGGFLGSDEYQALPAPGYTDDDLVALWDGGDDAGAMFDLPTLTPNYGWDTVLGREILPVLKENIANLPAMTEQLAPTLKKYYGDLMSHALGPDAFQETLNELSARNVLGSPGLVRDALSATAGRIAPAIAEQGNQAMLEGLKAQIGMPNMLAQLAQWGNQISDPEFAYRMGYQSLF